MVVRPLREGRAVPLVFVPTPLGNLRDVTLRALDVLRACTLVVAEDTRVARRLLAALELPAKPTWSYREQNAAAATAAILERAHVELIAVVTDAGMPAISDPGRDLVVAARAAQVAIEVLPGPSAFVCAAVLSGFDLDGFAFEGFAPRAPAERERRLRAALDADRTTVWYEAPHRIHATLATIDAVAPEARVFVVRELSKKFEQQLAGTAAEIAARLDDPARGEFALVLERRAPAIASARATPDDVAERIDAALAAGTTAPHIARDLAHAGYGTRADLYARVRERRDAGDDGKNR